MSDDALRIREATIARKVRRALEDEAACETCGDRPCEHAWVMIASLDEDIRELTAERDSLRAERDKYRGLIHAETIAEMHYCETCELAYQRPEFAAGKPVCPYCRVRELEDWLNGGAGR